MKHSITYFLLFQIFVTTLSAQSFTWIKGDSILNSTPIYGTMGISSPLNSPGARFGGATWTDNSGNLWLFGNGYTNDLWKYNPQINQWTWMNGSTVTISNGVYGSLGVPSSSNSPGGRYFSSYASDASGDLWMFGGFGYPVSTAGYLNDLWKYSITTNQWTWMSGSTLADQPGVYGTKGVASPNNVPGGRFGSTMFADASGNLWLFGGEYTLPSQSANNSFNDVWKYNIASQQWTWMSGSEFTSQPANYGIQGIPSPTNNPASLTQHCGWIDNANNLWIFGGATTAGIMNDLWKYTTTTNEWCWMRGSGIIKTTGLYGIANLPATSNSPGSFIYPKTWKDGAGNLILFGGMGVTEQGYGNTNNVWRYTISTNEWTWIKGDSTYNSFGNYGSLGVTNFTNAPGARMQFQTWSDLQGNGWVYGGDGFAATAGSNLLGDLWKFDNCYGLKVNADRNSICAGESTTLTASGGISYNWNHGASSNTFAVVPLSTGIYSLSGTLSTGCYQETLFILNVSKCTAINEITSENSIFLFPNPGENSFSIKGESLFTELFILDLSGRVVKQEAVTKNDQSFNISDLASGIYAVRLQNKNETRIIKLIKN